MSYWFAIAWLDQEGKTESTEMRGRFDDTAHRDRAIEEVIDDDPNAGLVVIPIDLEGDDEAVLEVSDLL